MTTQDKEFEKRLLATFLIEAEEHIRSVSSGLIELEKGLSGDVLNTRIESMFRDVHSLKGAARSVGQKDIEAVCHPLESVFSALKRHEIVLMPGLIDLFHDSVNAINQILASPHSVISSADRIKFRGLISRLGEAAKGKIEKPQAVSAEKLIKPDFIISAEEVVPLSGSVRVQAKRLDPMLLQAEELMISKTSCGQRVSDCYDIQNELQSLLAELALWKLNRATGWKDHSLEFFRLVEERMTALESLTDSLKRNLERDHHDMTRLLDEHLDGMKQLILMPVSTMAEGFPKFIRDLARDQRKEVSLVMHGTDMEIDRRILDELKDPLIHLLRNSVDHAIQIPQERVANSKPSHGTITLSFLPMENHQVEIKVSDDGKGIDPDRVLAKAIREGLVNPEDKDSLTPDAVTSFIFHSGISTSEVITDVSGRGVGLAIVREKVEKSGGTISVLTGKEGTVFRILMPLNFTTFRGVLVSDAGHSFMIPTTNLERVTMIPREQRVSLENKEAVIYRGEHLASVRLAEILNLTITANAIRNTAGLDSDNGLSAYAIVNVNGRRIAFQVDEVLSEHQFLLKNLGKQLRRVRYIAGATVLGTGQVVPVLNVADLVNSALKPRDWQPSESHTGASERKQKQILVAEDSITSRMLLKNILEAAGYVVTTAVDGVDALTRAKEGEFDLLVSDVDMPRMNGFELTRKIRHDSRLKELPVVLVTSLSRREDHEQGIEAGANAYIVKSNFEQSNLLEVVRKLI
ncbi:MAG: hybrid sensor histidine kinase/response regulator [Bacteroidales bacterium]